MPIGKASITVILIASSTARALLSAPHPQVVLFACLVADFFCVALGGLSFAPPVCRPVPPCVFMTLLSSNMLKVKAFLSHIQNLKVLEGLKASKSSLLMV
jgi:hypothetical protein